MEISINRFFIDVNRLVPRSMFTEYFLVPLRRIITLRFPYQLNSEGANKGLFSRTDCQANGFRMIPEKETANINITLKLVCEKCRY